MPSAAKQLATLLKDLERQGWRIEPIKKGWMVYPPDSTKRGVTIHKTPSDHRSWANMIATLRRSGYTG